MKFPTQQSTPVKKSGVKNAKYEIHITNPSFDLNDDLAKDAAEVLNIHKTLFEIQNKNTGIIQKNLELCNEHTKINEKNNLLILDIGLQMKQKILEIDLLMEKFEKVIPLLEKLEKMVNI